MNLRTIGLVIRREYLNRVKKKSFILTTLLVPILVAGLTIGVIALLMNTKDKVKSTAVLDESGIVMPYLEDTATIHYTDCSGEDLDALKALCDEGTPLIILCHVPISTPCCKEELHRVMDYFYIDEETADENGKEFVELCEKNDTVKAVLCGHVHGYHATELVPGKPQIIGSQGMAGAVHLFTVAGE